MPVNPALRRLRKENCKEFQVNLDDRDGVLTGGHGVGRERERRGKVRFGGAGGVALRPEFTF